MSNFNIDEKHISQIPALQLLINMGYEFISPEKTLKERKETHSMWQLNTVWNGQKVQRLLDSTSFFL